MAMTIGELKDILVHFDRDEDDYQIILWDYNHQQELEWGASHASSKNDRTLVFPVCVFGVNEENINERIRRLINEYYEGKNEAE